MIIILFFMNSKEQKAFVNISLDTISIKICRDFSICFTLFFNYI